MIMVNEPKVHNNSSETTSNTETEQELKTEKTQNTSDSKENDASVVNVFRSIQKGSRVYKHRRSTDWQWAVCFVILSLAWVFIPWYGKDTKCNLYNLISTYIHHKCYSVH